MEFPKAERLRIYTGRRPASADDPITDQTLLLDCAVTDIEWLPASMGSPKFKFKTETAEVLDWGTASWFRIFGVDDRVLLDGDVGDSLVDLHHGLTFPVLAWTPGMVVHIGET